MELDNDLFQNPGICSIFGKSLEGTTTGCRTMVFEKTGKIGFACPTCSQLDLFKGAKGVIVPDDEIDNSDTDVEAEIVYTPKLVRYKCCYCGREVTETAERFDRDELLEGGFFWNCPECESLFGVRKVKKQYDDYN